MLEQNSGVRCRCLMLSIYFLILEQPAASSTNPCINAVIFTSIISRNIKRSGLALIGQEQSVVQQVCIGFQLLIEVLQVSFERQSCRTPV